VSAFGAHEQLSMVLSMDPYPALSGSSRRPERKAWYDGLREASDGAAVDYEILALAK